jgi:hypothetical protein
LVHFKKNFNPKGSKAPKYVKKYFGHEQQQQLADEKSFLNQFTHSLLKRHFLIYNSRSRRRQNGFLTVKN